MDRRLDPIPSIRAPRLLRKWHTEEIFRKQVHKNSEEYSQLLVEYIIDKYNTFAKKIAEKLLQQPLEEIENNRPENLSFEDLSDAWRYSHILMGTIEKALLNVTRKNDSIPLLLTIIFVVFDNLARLEANIGRLIKPSDFQVQFYTQHMLKILILDKLKELFLKKNINEQEKKFVMFSIGFLKKI